MRAGPPVVRCAIGIGGGIDGDSGIRILRRDLTRPETKPPGNHCEADDDLPFDESLGKNDFVSDAPFDGPATSAVIGIGGGADGFYGLRAAYRRLLEAGARTALERGLKWLARHQSRDGSWEGRRANTGLALLAFLGAAQTHRHGSHKKVLKSGLRYLKFAQADDGCLADREQSGWLAEHAILTLVLTEAYAVTGSPLFKQASQRGLDLLAKTASPDVATTSWRVLAFRAAEGTVLRLPEGWKAAALEAMAEATPGLLPSTRLSTSTAAGFAGILAGADPAGVPLSLPDWSADPVQAHFAGLVLFQAGRNLWATWERRLLKSIVDFQIAEPAGTAWSWSPVGPDSKLLGRVGTTALACLTLETPIRYARVTRRTTAEAAREGAR